MFFHYSLRRLERIVQGRRLPTRFWEHLAACQQCRDLFGLVLATQEPADSSRPPAMAGRHIEVTDHLGFLSGTISPRQRDEIARHLLACDECRGQLAELGQAASDLATGTDVQPNLARVYRARQLWQQASGAAPATTRRPSSKNPMTICIVADDSQSMAGAPSREVTESIRDFVTMIQAAGDGARSYFRLLLVKFGDFPSVIYDRTPILDIDAQQIELSGASGGTDIAAALELVDEKLTRDSRHANAVSPLVVLFSDGSATGADPVPWAKRIKSIGYPAGQVPLLVTCGLGQADKGLLQQVATSTEHYKDLTSPGEFREFLTAVGSTVSNFATEGGTAPSLDRQIRGIISRSV